MEEDEWFYCLVQMIRLIEAGEKDQSGRLLLLGSFVSILCLSVC